MTSLIKLLFSVFPVLFFRIKVNNFDNQAGFFVENFNCVRNTVPFLMSNGHESIPKFEVFFTKLLQKRRYFAPETPEPSLVLPKRVPKLLPPPWVVLPSSYLAMGAWFL